MQLLLLIASFLSLCCGHVVRGHVIHVNMTDNVQRGTKIVDLRQSLSSQHEPSVLAQLTFAFLSNADSLFHLDASTGTLTAARSLDRDQLCPGRRACVRRVDVGVQPARYFTKLRVEVSFDDVNDNTPRFQTTVERLEVLINSIFPQTLGRNQLSTSTPSYPNEKASILNF